MDRATLDGRNRVAVGRWYRALVDGDGEVPAGLLGELRAIADEHARPDMAAIAEWVKANPQEIARMVRINGGTLPGQAGATPKRSARGRASA